MYKNTTFSNFSNAVGPCELKGHKMHYKEIVKPVKGVQKATLTLEFVTKSTFLSTKQSKLLYAFYCVVSQKIVSWNTIRRSRLRRDLCINIGCVVFHCGAQRCLSPQAVCIIIVLSAPAVYKR